ncbi:hypothetical protein U7230_10020 [Carboxydochorda subterranea]|uniref:Cytochrome b/b6 C-terminal region profile domain-containing protein n=1 Tax=Carboxydichorda subterranea TaxID=3109565 RepID=A0ABZ1BWC3_9FIRM|nr:hypothetical protein [Limnochorda sp. L945t]WRP16432.1 hypothetical protein U7230_10020 [Limnochorda sp. L945t]
MTTAQPQEDRAASRVAVLESAAAPSPAARPRPSQENPDEKVHTWPYLVRIEFVGALLYLFLLSLMSVFVDAPLASLANPDVTPNPAKAPWYFLGLQELLLHMDKALAGVIVPGAVLVLLAAIPYVDHRRKGTGIWFYSPKGVPIALFSFAYTSVWNVGLILVDQFLMVPGEQGGHGIGPIIRYWLHSLRQGGGYGFLTDSVVNGIAGWIVPIFIMLLIPTSLALIVRRRWQADTREVLIGLFTFFVASFVVLTVVGTAFRGEGMNLMWPWQVKQANH